MNFFNENLSRIFKDNKEIIDARKEAYRQAILDIEDLERELRFLNISHTFQIVNAGNANFIVSWESEEEHGWRFMVERMDPEEQFPKVPLKTCGEEIVRIVESFLPRMVKHMFEDNGIIKR